MIQVVLITVGGQKSIVRTHTHPTGLEATADNLATQIKAVLTVSECL